MSIAVTSFPGALDDDTSLVAPTNNASTTLSSDINNSVTTIPVASAAAMPASGIILIDSELISYTGKTSNSFMGATRAFEGTPAASHTSGATVAFVLTAQMWDALKDAVIALQTKIGFGADTPDNGQIFVGNTTAGTSHWRQGVPADVGLGNVDNTSDTGKPVSTAQQAALNLKANALDAALAGNPTAPTQVSGNNTTRIATTAFVKQEIDVVKNGVSSSFDTLAEIATELGNKVPTSRQINGSTLSADITVTDANLSTSDVTTNNASTSKHGFLKKLSNVAGEFMNGQGNWVAPSGSGDMVLASVQSVTGAKTFDDGKLLLNGGDYGATDASMPGSPVEKAFYLNTNASSRRLFFYVGGAFHEIFMSGISGPVSVALGGTGGTSHTGILKGNGSSPISTATEYLSWALSDESTAVTTGVKLTDRAPFAFTITGVRTSLSTASSSGLVTLNIKKNGITIFSTQVSIDASEKTSTTAATEAVLSTTALADDDELTFDITAAGTGAKGLKVRIYGHQ